MVVPAYRLPMGTGAGPRDEDLATEVLDGVVDGVGRRSVGPGALVDPYRRVWLRLRAVLAVVWVVAAVGTLVLVPRPSSLDGLQAAIQQGRVTEVTVVGGLPAGSTGWATVDVVWRERGVLRSVTVQEVRGDDAPHAFDSSGWSGGTVLPQVGDVATDLQALPTPGGPVQVERRAFGEGTGVAGSAWVALPLLGSWLAGLYLLVAGPEPWRATRWAWFWLSWPPFGLLAFVVLSGPVARLSWTPPQGRRLTGGRALLVSLLLTAVLPSTWWWSVG